MELQWLCEGFWVLKFYEWPNCSQENENFFPCLPVQWGSWWTAWVIGVMEGVSCIWLCQWRGSFHIFADLNSKAKCKPRTQSRVVHTTAKPIGLLYCRHVLKGCLNYRSCIYVTVSVLSPTFPQEWEQKVPEFSAWRRRQEELPVMRGLKLNALLITPVQRIPRSVPTAYPDQYQQGIPRSVPTVYPDQYPQHIPRSVPTGHTQVSTHRAYPGQYTQDIPRSVPTARTQVSAYRTYPQHPSWSVPTAHTQVSTYRAHAGQYPQDTPRLAPT